MFNPLANLVILFGCSFVCTIMGAIWLTSGLGPRTTQVLNFIAALLAMLLSLYLLVKR